MIDAVLRAGDRVHTALSDAVGHPGDRLSFEEVQTAINHVGESTSVIFPQGILSGDVFSKARNPPYMTLEEGFATAANSGALQLRILEYTIAIKKLPDGCFLLFDPHARNARGFVDGNGHATIMTFLSLDSAVNYIRKFVRQKGLETETPNSDVSLSLAEHSFEMMPISTRNKGQQTSCVSRLIKRTAPAQEPKNSARFKR